MKIRFIRLALAFGAATLLLQCSSEDKVVNEPREPVALPDYTFVQFDVASGDPSAVAIPNDILRNPFTGNVNLPFFGIPAVDALIAQVNTLRGFSTTGPMRIPFVGKVVADTVDNNSLLVVDLIDLNAFQSGQPVNPFREMRYDVRDDASGENSVIFAFPVRPLTPGRPHLAIVTQGVVGEASGLPVESESLTILLKGETPFVDAAGNSTRASLDNATAAQLEPLRQAYQPIWSVAEAVTQQDRVFIPFALAFTTQPLFDTLDEMRKRVQNENPALAPLNSFVGAAAVDAFYNALGVGAAPHDNVGGVYFNAFNAPNYISNPVNGPFQGSGPALVEVSRQNLATITVTPFGEGPFPTIIYQHGFGSLKESVLLLADTACSQGYAVIGIDMVLHGSRSADLINNQTGAAGPDGVPDPSGTNFINLINLLMSRDNVRQSAGDLFALTRVITSGAGDLNGDGTAELSPTGVTFVGISMGGIVGTSFVAVETDIAIANLNVAGGRLPFLLQGSATFGPAINGGLAAVGLAPGTPLYDLYFIFAQAIVDDADPLNYATTAFSGSLASNQPTTVLLQEMIGDNVVPNFATNDLALALGIDQVDAVEAVAGLNQVSAPHLGSGFFQFPEGAHGALVAPDPATPAVRLQTFTFLGSALAGQPTVINPLTSGKLDGSSAPLNLEGLFNQDLTTMLRLPQKTE